MLNLIYLLATLATLISASPTSQDTQLTPLCIAPQIQCSHGFDTSFVCIGTTHIVNCVNGCGIPMPLAAGTICYGQGIIRAMPAALPQSKDPASVLPKAPRPTTIVFVTLPGTNLLPHVGTATPAPSVVTVTTHLTAANPKVTTTAKPTEKSTENHWWVASTDDHNWVTVLKVERKGI